MVQGERFGLRLSGSERLKLQRLADARGLAASELLRRLISEALEFEPEDQMVALERFLGGSRIPAPGPETLKHELDSRLDEQLDHVLGGS